MKVVGYADKLSVEPGAAITFMVSSEPGRFSAQLVRLIHGDENPAGPGYKDVTISSTLDGEYEGGEQKLRTGSYLRAPSSAELDGARDLTVQTWICPTLPSKAVQTIVSRGGADGFALRLEDGRLTLRLGSASVSVDQTVRAGQWYFVAAVHDAATGRVLLTLEPSAGATSGLGARLDTVVDAAPTSGAGDVLVAAEVTAEGEVGNFYNGKIDAPKIFTRALGDDELAALRDDADTAPTDAVAAWDFSQGIDTWSVVDASGRGHDAEAVNKPARGMTGRNWTGREMSWKHAPSEYGAIHFHDDDLSDAAWTPSFEWTVPDDFRSGVYAVHLTSGDHEDYVPFYVVPPLGRPTADTAIILPVFSYLAYANEQMLGPTGVYSGQLAGYPRQPQDKYVVETGLRSLYDRHTDGSGVCYSSWLRPIVNMRPKYDMPFLDMGEGSPHQFNADLHLIDWLEQKGIEFDIITDLEVHRDGVSRLNDYRVVSTASHNEYWSEAMLDAGEAYVNGGGRFMYLSGNGMYWVTALDEATGTGVEIRRSGPAQRCWDAAPGEATLSSTGEPGGLWRFRGRAPQRWLGVGSIAEGGGVGRPYDRQPGSHDPRAAFIFEGIADDEQIGAFPCLVNSWGAAGFEICQTNPKLGTPEHTVVLASARDFDTSDWGVFSEELQLSAIWDGEIRADMVFIEYPNGGAVFGVGSISWCGSLSHNNYDNNVSRVTENVFRGFASETLPA
ncbi:MULTISPECIES: N,N-dimethylformamidase beta subunit family domain-containing protein [Nocardiaceae]|uniref:N,N-dimethylformamidase n=1 Tax=Rhodococcoides corynebacterioides TaxID=53972 RepID=A0ABS2KZL0_9NOCA|nr:MULTISPECIES: N,N-dimethylformamidase beta subunit family domain-containing protein [Rhodococcus]MBM7417371.1 N,N-dimethylformamidase [Rhodococcus corynebacterioides]MBP1115625.1 N,N-dimethylformamidase [Rhodococcus sp. PvP016]